MLLSVGKLGKIFKKSFGDYIGLQNANKCPVISDLYGEIMLPSQGLKSLGKFL